MDTEPGTAMVRFNWILFLNMSNGNSNGGACCVGRICTWTATDMPIFESITRRWTNDRQKNGPRVGLLGMAWHSLLIERTDTNRTGFDCSRWLNTGVQKNTYSSYCTEVGIKYLGEMCYRNCTNAVQLLWTALTIYETCPWRGNKFSVGCGAYQELRFFVCN